MTTTEPLDPEVLLPAAGKLGEDLGAYSATIMCAIGNRLGLTDALAAGPATPAELAGRAGIDERYTLEWLRCLVAAGYVDRDGTAYRWHPPYDLLLTDAAGPFAMGGLYDLVGALAANINEVVEAARGGHGIAQSDYPPDVPAGIARINAPIYDHALVDEWMPQADGVVEALQSGAAVAEVGCGAGRALIALARSYPDATYTGYDVFAPALELARTNAAAARVSELITFEQLDGTGALPGRHDVVLLFDVLHDSGDAAAILANVRSALNDGGRVLIMEPRSQDDPAANLGPVATTLYATSLAYCLPVSLAAGGPGLGTCGLPEAALRDLCLAAGFTTLDQTPVFHPAQALYIAR
jgi:2-polyprenyl-3-methyl-5-hydroxy-6-metoxy-1,4-benzoquinol methylase